MREDEFDTFSALLDDVAALLPRAGQQPLNGTAKAMYFRALGAHDWLRCAALDAHVRDPQRGRFFPAPADVMAQLEGAAADDGRPGPEEAWAIALTAVDERSTVVWTDEMAEAWFAAKPVFDIGDEVGARMAFREAYSRIIGEARKHRAPMAWRVSLGFDKAARRSAVEAAVQAGRLPEEELLKLPVPEAGDALLLAGPARTPVAEQARAALRDMAEHMRSRATDLTIDTAERDAANARKAEIAASVAAYTRDSDAA